MNKDIAEIPNILNDEVFLASEKLGITELDPFFELDTVLFDDEVVIEEDVS